MATFQKVQCGTKLCAAESNAHSSRVCRNMFAFSFRLRVKQSSFVRGSFTLLLALYSHDPRIFWYRNVIFNFNTGYVLSFICTSAPYTIGCALSKTLVPTEMFLNIENSFTPLSDKQRMLWIHYSVQLLGATIIPRKVTEFFRSIIHETVSTREKEGVVRPDMIQLLMQAKKRTLKDEASSENTKDTDKDYGMYDNN